MIINILMIMTNIYYYQHSLDDAIPLLQTAVPAGRRQQVGEEDSAQEAGRGQLDEREAPLGLRHQAQAG